MANTLRFKRGLVSGIPTAALGEPLFTTDTFDLYIGNGTTNTRFQKYIASGTTSQLLRGDGSLLTMPIVLTSPSNGQVLKYNGTSWVNDSDAGITGTGTTNYLPKFTGASTLGNSLVFDNGTNVGINSTVPLAPLTIHNPISNAAVLELRGGGGSSQSRLLFSYGNSTSQSDQNALILANSTALSFSAFSTRYISFDINSVERMRLDAGGNLGLGVTPFGWAGGTRAIDFGSGSALWNPGSTTNTYLTTNAYFDITDNRWEYKGTGGASTYHQFGNEHRWNIAASGTANAAITFTQPMTLTANGRLLLGTITEGTQRLQVAGDTIMVGSGNTSATTALTVQDSAGNNILRLRNDLAALFNFVGTSLTMSGEANYTIMSANQAFYFRSNGGTAGRAFKIFDNATSLTGTTGANQNIQSFITFAPTSGTATYTDLDLFSTINQTGGANGITRGLYVRPTLTAAADWRSIEWSNNTGWGLYGAGTSLNYLNGFLLLGSTTSTGEKLQVRGTMKVTGASTFGGNLTVDTDTFPVESGTNRVGIGGTAPNGKLEIFGSLGNFRVLDSGAEVYFTRNNNNDIFANGGTSASLSIGGNSHVRFLTGSTLTELARFTTNAFQFSDGINVVLNATTGTKFGTATSQKIGFWNAAPIIQPTTGVAAATRVAGGGATITDTDTFDGYTVNQIVKALRNTGLLA